METNGKKILVVDDEQDIVSVISKVLTKCGYDTITAADGLEGIAKAQSELPDLILLDNLMPNMNGLAALEGLKALEETKDIPVIMVTVLADEDNVNNAIKNGAIGYVIKPFERDVLLEKINTILECKYSPNI